MRQDQPAWTVTSVLPNIELAEPIEGGLISLVPREDPRMKEIYREQPNIEEFIRRFRDAFGRKLSPAIMIIRSDAPTNTFTSEAIANFRDAIALATVPYSRAQELQRPHGLRINFSNSFWIYPWMMDRHGESLTTHTPAMLATHDLDLFYGQSSPETPVRVFAESDIDRPLFGALTSRWNRHYTNARQDWPDIALFRSLNMANQASLVPAGPEVTFYDAGRAVALWVSAFEILAHPGGREKSNLNTVYDLLDRAPWHHRRCRESRYKAYEVNKKFTQRRSFGCWLYGKLYRARNDFLHGNPVTGKNLQIKRAGRNLFRYAAPLYRMALASFLELKLIETAPSIDDLEAFVQHFSKHRDLLHFQKVIEEGLLTAHG